MKFLSHIARLCAALQALSSRWSLALVITLLFAGLWVWLDVSLRMLPGPVTAKRESVQTPHVTAVVARKVANPAR